MKIKKLATLMCAVAVTLSLAGCTGRNKLPEGDVKAASQQVSGVVNLLLASAGYGADQSTVTSFMLPEGSQYDITLTMEKYADGNLVDTTDIANYTTGTFAKNSIMHIILNTAKVGSTDTTKSIYSLAEVDPEKTTDSKNPEYKITRFESNALDYDSKSEIGQSGKNFGEDLPIAGYVKFKDNDTEKKAIDVANYKDQVGNYSEATIIKMSAVKK